MCFSRRNLLKGLALGSGSMLLPTMAQRIMANAEGRTSAPRFVFVIQSNGFDAVQACPDGIPFQKYEDREKFDAARAADTRPMVGASGSTVLRAPTPPPKASPSITSWGRPSRASCLGLA